MEDCKKAQFHLPGLFEFFSFYKEFLPIFFQHRDWFYDWCNIASIYGAPDHCIWGGGRFGSGEDCAEDVLQFVNGFGISARLTFSNSLLREEHLVDAKCNQLCEAFNHNGGVQNGVIVHSDLLLEYLQQKYSGLYFVSSTTKVLTNINEAIKEINREAFRYVVPDFRLNKNSDFLNSLSSAQKEKVEFLCNECCWIGCKDRKQCYENVSRRMLGESCEEFHCTAPDGADGYKFSKAMNNPTFISRENIQNIYLPLGFTNFKIEGRGLGTAILLEFILYYLTKPEHHLEVRERLYLDSMLDLF